MKAAQNLAGEHRQAGCSRSAPSMQVVPAPPAMVEILKRDLGIKNDGDLAYFAQVATHKGLDPFLGEIVPVYYGGEMVIQDTVEGLRTIAERSGLYDGFDGPYWCGPDLDWKPVWLADEPPAAARYSVRRKDWSEPVVGVARWKSSVQLDRYGKPAQLWKTRPDEMLGKTAEVRALKRAFPKEFARAGVSVRDLSDAQVVTIEARRAGLDDDGRHQLVSDVTDGRTESTTELTEDEVLEVRAEVARLAGPPTDTAEDAVARAIARAAGDLEQRMERLTPSQTDQIKQWRITQGLTRPLHTLSPTDRTRIAAELDRRDQDGWDTTPEHVEEPADENDVVPDDVIEPDLFDDTEPF
jgi:phage recombination protein Bet